jgi:hypothetical protein
MSSLDERQKGISESSEALNPLRLDEGKSRLDCFCTPLFSMPVRTTSYFEN